MGMFDYVTHVPETECESCGAPLSGWQSKDGPCLLKEIPFWEINNFYTYCEAEDCGEWHEYDRESVRPPTSISEEFGRFKRRGEDRRLPRTKPLKKYRDIE